MSKDQTVLKIGIAGLGVVGGETARQLINNADRMSMAAGVNFQICAVNARSRETDRGFDMGAMTWVDHAPDMAAIDELDIIIEMIGGSDGVALDLARVALRAGKHFVTANKALLAHHGTELASLAEAHNCALMFEAAVAGGIPAVKTLREGLAGNEVTRVSGILNGTCNYILTRMEKTGEAFDDVLADAQKLGYAEAEPSFDVDGIDAAHKLTLLAAIAFGQTPNFEIVDIKGIRDVSTADFSYANQLGFRIKLVGVAEPGRVPQMQACLLPRTSQLAKVDGVLNAVEYRGHPVNSTISIGPGAGAGPTSSAVLADLIDVARNRWGPAFGRPVAELSNGADMQNGLGLDKPYYIRLMVRDQSGVLADVTRILQQHDISVESLVQQGRSPGEAVPLVMIAHEASGASIQAILTAFTALDCVLSKPVALPILVDDLEG